MRSSRVASALVVASAVLLTLDVAVWLAGESPRRVLTMVLAGTLGSAYGFAQTLAKATPLVWTGAAVALCLRARLFNIGAEGQCLMGVLAAALVGHALPEGTPRVLAVPTAMTAAAAAGGGLGFVAGWMRARLGTHEVISTLMLNGLVAVLTTWLYAGPLRVGVQVHTAPVVAGARLPQMGRLVQSVHGSALNLSLVMAVLATVAMGRYLTHARGGVAIRAMGSAPRAAEALGIDTARATMRVFALSGALAGLAGTHFVLGVKGYAEQGLGAGVGFTGVAVALLGGLRPLGIVAAALLFGAMAQGALVVNARVPADVLTLTQAATILAVGALAARTLHNNDEGA